MIEEKIRGRDRKYFEEEENAKEFKAFCGRCKDWVIQLG